MARIWIISEKKWRDESERRWVCEWHEFPPNKSKVELDELWERCGPDCLIARVRGFGANGKGLAVSFAKRIAAAQTTFGGCASVYEEAVDVWCRADRAGDWMKIGNPEEIEA